MKLGTLAIRIVKRHLEKHDHHLHRDWPKDIYDRLRNVDALGDGKYEHQFSILYAPLDKRIGATLIDIHGGAYIYSYRDNNFGFADVFCKRGYDVVLLDYPHNDKTRGCDTQIQVLAAQLAYLHAHRSDLGLDKGSLGIMGDSAGGHLALLLALASGDHEIATKLGIDLNDININGVALGCPVYDFVGISQGPMLTRGARQMMFGPKFDDLAEMSRLSPLTYIESLKIPVYLNSCRHDFIGGQSQALHEDLQRLGKPHVYRYLDTDNRGVDHVHNVTKISMEESVLVNGEIGDFFDKLFAHGKE